MRFLLPHDTAAWLVAAALLGATLGCGDTGGGHDLDGATDDGGAPDGSSTLVSQMRVASNDPGAPDMVDASFYSAALGRTAQVRLLLPSGFESQPERRWPVLYLLHGANESLGYRAWTEQTSVESLAQGLDLIVAMPEAGLSGWYSDWLERCESSAEDADEQPAWEAFHLTELPTVLREQFRASDVRSIAGLSMGGFGAVSYAGRHPGMFRAVASYSGALRTSTNASLVQLSLQIAGCSNSNAVWGSLGEHPEVWAAHDPYELVDRVLDVPLYVSSGDGSAGPLDAPTGGADLLETLAQSANQKFIDRVHELGGTKLTTNMYGPGTHSWPYWDRELASSFALLTAPLLAP